MHALKQQTEMLGKVQKWLGAISLVAVAAFVLLIYRPQARKIVELQATWRKEYVSLDANQTEAQRLLAVAQEVEILRQKLDRFDKRLPSQEELGQFMKDIATYQQQAELKKMTWSRGQPRHSELFAELPLTLNFEGDYLSVLTFLRRTEEMPRLTRVRGLTLKTRDDKAPGQVDVQLSMNIYFTE